MVFNVLKNFSQFNLVYVNISWDIDKNPHIPQQTYMRQLLEIMVDDDLYSIRLEHDTVSEQVNVANTLPLQDTSYFWI